MIIRSRTIMRTKKEREKRKDSVAFCRSSGSLFSVRSEASRSLVLERVSCMVFSLSIMHGTAPRCSRTTYEVRVVQSYQVLLWTTARAILFIECSTEYALTTDLLFIYPCLRCTKKKKKRRGCHWFLQVIRICRMEKTFIRIMYACVYTHRPTMSNEHMTTSIWRSPFPARLPRFKVKARSFSLCLPCPLLWDPDQPVQKHCGHSIEPNIRKEQSHVTPAVRIVDVDPCQELVRLRQRTDLAV